MATSDAWTGVETTEVDEESEPRVNLKVRELLFMDKILHDLKDSKLWELWYIPILSIDSTTEHP